MYLKFQLYALFDLIPYVPVNNFSGMSGRVLIICLGKCHNAVTLVMRLEPQPHGLESNTIIEPLRKKSVH